MHWFAVRNIRNDKTLANFAKNSRTRIKLVYRILYYEINFLYYTSIQKINKLVKYLMSNITFSLAAVSVNTLIALLAKRLFRRTFSRRITNFTDIRFSLETDLQPVFTINTAKIYFERIYISKLFPLPEQHKLVSQ